MLLALAEKSCLATFLTKKSSARVQVFEHRTAEFVGRHAAALQIGGEPGLKGLKLAHSGLAASLTRPSLDDRPEISPEFWRERREFFIIRGVRHEGESNGPNSTTRRPELIHQGQCRSGREVLGAAPARASRSSSHPCVEGGPRSAGTATAWTPDLPTDTPRSADSSEHSDRPHFARSPCSCKCLGLAARHDAAQGSGSRLESTTATSIRGTHQGPRRLRSERYTQCPLPWNRGAISYTKSPGCARSASRGIGDT